MLVKWLINVHVSDCFTVCRRNSTEQSYHVACQIIIVIVIVIVLIIIIIIVIIISRRRRRRRRRRRPGIPLKLSGEANNQISRGNTQQSTIPILS
jgi:heme/copper-type cytochrome/quinol oxidase subunit 2